MKKSKILLLTLLSCSLMLGGCGGSKDSGSATTPTPNETPNIVVDDTDLDNSEAEATPTPEITEEPEETKEGYVRSDLTNEWIDESLADTRPLSMMVPINTSALPHYNISNAGVIYECLAEGKISRMLCVFDDWTDMERIGNIRSARAYYVAWAMEWDSILCHFGQVLYADPLLNSAACDHLDGNACPAGYGFYRVKDEGRISEQTAYASSELLLKACDYYGISTTHTEYYSPDHWQFASENNPEDLTRYDDSFECTYIDCSNSFPNSKTHFEYNEEDGLYYRFIYGDPHMDGATDTQLAFTNVIIQYCDYVVLDEYDHLEYHYGSGDEGYYITNGQAIPITWDKGSETDPTKYYDSEGNEIYLNTGKTMICICGTNTTVEFE